MLKSKFFFLVIILSLMFLPPCFSSTLDNASATFTHAPESHPADGGVDEGSSGSGFQRNPEAKDTTAGRRWSFINKAIGLADSNQRDIEKYPDYQFAKKYTVQEIINNPAKAAAFEKEYLIQEAEYFAIARNPETGLTYDGYKLDPKTGKPTEPRDWSAPSKECLDTAICIKAIEGNPRAAMVVGKGDIEASKKIAAGILDKKIDSYVKFREKYPGYGGMMPWFISRNEVSPTNDWVGRIPGLDNGEWLWALLVSEKMLRDQGFDKVADKYADYIEKIRDKAVEIFYDEKAGKIRADVIVTDPTSPDSRYETATGKDGVGKYLSGDDCVHEGSMAVMFVTLFGKGLPKDAPAKIWNNTEMTRIEHKYGTTWRGCWGSAHESWAYLFMPLRDMKGFRDLFRIREKIRTRNAAERGYPGFATSTNRPGGKPGYLDGVGIEGVGILDVPKNDSFAIYGAFPLLLECADEKEKAGNYGLAWLLNMLKAPAMQGPIGGGESGTNDGKAVSYIKTIDGSFPNIIALTGGLGKETADMLKQYGKYDQFKKIMLNEYNESFGNKPLNEPCGFALPNKTVPTGEVEDYK